MKYFPFLSVIFSTLVFGQSFGNAYYKSVSGPVSFAVTEKSKLGLENIDSATTAKTVEKVNGLLKKTEGVKKYILSFSGQKAIYAWDSSQEEPAPESFRDKEDSVFFDLEKGVRIRQRELQGIKVRVSQELKDIPWQLTDETKTILGYVCKKAIYIEPRPARRPGGRTFERVYVAWYTEELPYGFGPLGFGGLPGLIVSLNDHFILEKVDLEPPIFPVLEPRKGKRMTEKQFLEKALGYKL